MLVVRPPSVILPSTYWTDVRRDVCGSGSDTKWRIPQLSGSLLVGDNGWRRGVSLGVSGLVVGSLDIGATVSVGAE